MLIGIIAHGSDAEGFPAAAAARALVAAGHNVEVSHTCTVDPPASLRTWIRRFDAVLLCAALPDVLRSIVVTQTEINEWLEVVYGSGVSVCPSRAAVEWACGKRYLKALQRQGVVIPNTRFLASCPHPMPSGSDTLHLKMPWASSGRGHAVVSTPEALEAYCGRSLGECGREFVICQPHHRPFVERKVFPALGKLTPEASRLHTAVVQAARADGITLPPWYRLDMVRVEGQVYVNEIEFVAACILNDKLVDDVGALYATHALEWWAATAHSTINASFPLPEQFTWAQRINANGKRMPKPRNYLH